MSEQSESEKVLASMYIEPGGEYGYATCLRVAQASRAAALEAAAKVCDGSVSIDEADEEWNDACEGCAHKIRTLAKEPA